MIFTSVYKICLWTLKKKCHCSYISHQKGFQRLILRTYSRFQLICVFIFSFAFKNYWEFSILDYRIHQLDSLPNIWKKQSNSLWVLYTCIIWTKCLLFPSKASCFVWLGVLNIFFYIFTEFSVITKWPISFFLKFIQFHFFCEWKCLKTLNKILQESLISQLININNLDRVTALSLQ